MRDRTTGFNINHAVRAQQSIPFGVAATATQTLARAMPNTQQISAHPSRLRRLRSDRCRRDHRTCAHVRMRARLCMNMHACYLAGGCWLLPLLPGHRTDLIDAMTLGMKNALIAHATKCRDL